MGSGHLGGVAEKGAVGSVFEGAGVEERLVDAAVPPHELRVEVGGCRRRVLYVRWNWGA